MLDQLVVSRACLLLTNRQEQQKKKLEERCVKRKIFYFDCARSIVPRYNKALVSKQT